MVLHEKMTHIKIKQELHTLFAMSDLIYPSLLEQCKQHSNKRLRSEASL